ncbi:unnamed protein product [Calicophoron daubneyi]|uniref:Cadherin domain-containing protein n=1 Tax=Calicophoron daubneyi TaxID=300641 RepID=A0AAV2TQ76_CALDB
MHKLSIRTLRLWRKVWIMFILLISSLTVVICDEDRTWNALLKRSSRGRISHHSLTYEIVEESQRGTLVGNIATDITNMLRGNEKDEEKSILKIDLTVTNFRDRTVQFFALEPSSGQLRVSTPPDREFICPNTGITDGSSSSESSFPNTIVESGIAKLADKSILRGATAPDVPCIFDIRVAYKLRTPLPKSQPSSDKKIPFEDPGLINVQVIIRDKNDHPPTFPQPRLTFELGELSSLPEKTVIDLPAAFDPDAGENGTIVYWLEASAGSTTTQRNKDFFRKEKIETGIPFRLEGNPLRLVLTRTLDWETQPEYNLIVFAQDLGQSKPLLGQMHILISVRDENDNVPQFTQSSYSVMINESILRGAIIIELSAKDADSSSNGQLTFSLAPPSNVQERTALQYFGIRTVSSNQAAIYVIQTLDVDSFRRQPLLESPPSKQSDTYVETLHPDNQKFVFYAVVRDSGYPRQLSSRAMIEVIVADVNDMAPVIFVSYLHTNSEEETNPKYVGFGQTSLTTDRTQGEIKENTDRAFIAFVTVQDFDSGVWGQVQCSTNIKAFELIPVSETDSSVSSASGNNVGDFGSHPSSSGFTGSNSGEYGFKLLAVQPFDREETSEISFRIICVDNPQQSTSDIDPFVQHVAPSYSERLSYTGNGNSNLQLTGRALVRVAIADENDNAPVFQRNQYTFSIDEANELTDASLPFVPEVHVFLGQVSATDKDSTSRLRYFIDENLVSTFSVDQDSGKIYAHRYFDREGIYEKAKISEPFEDINVKTEIENADTIYLCFLVFVTDGLHNASTEVRLLIRDVNDKMPVFTKTHYEFTVMENEQPIHSGYVGEVQARDADSGGNANIFYRIVDINEPRQFENSTQPGWLPSISYFSIGLKTGRIHLIRKVDRESQTHHIFYVLAVDDLQDTQVLQPHIHSAYTVHTATATVTIIVGDVNDNTPRITYPPSHGVINVEAGAPAGHNLFTVIAEDPDAGENGTVRFTLSMANFERSKSSLNLVHSGETETRAVTDTETINLRNGPFSIDETTGIVFVVETLSEHSANYLLVIGAHDLGRPTPRKTTSTVTIRVQNTQLFQALSARNLGEGGDAAAELQQPKSISPSSDSSHQENNGASGKIIGKNHAGSQSAQDSRREFQKYTADDKTWQEMEKNGAGRFLSLSDRTVVIILAIIFIMLLVTTVVLILLIKRRRDLENQRITGQKMNYDRSPDPHHAESCSLNVKGAKLEDSSTLSGFQSTFLRGRPYDPSELEHLEFGAQVYGKTNVYDPEAVGISKLPGDYQQVLYPRICDTVVQDPACCLRSNICSSSKGNLQASSLELLDMHHSLSESDEGPQGPAGPIPAQIRALCTPVISSSQVRFDAPQNNRERRSRRDKRYQTIDHLTRSYEDDGYVKPQPVTSSHSTFRKSSAIGGVDPDGTADERLIANAYCSLGDARTKGKLQNSQPNKTDRQIEDTMMEFSCSNVGEPTEMTPVCPLSFAVDSDGLEQVESEEQSLRGRDCSVNSKPAGLQRKQKQSDNEQDACSRTANHGKGVSFV